MHYWHDTFRDHPSLAQGRSPSKKRAILQVQQRNPQNMNAPHWVIGAMLLASTITFFMGRLSVGLFDYDEEETENENGAEEQ
jgi:hypothetical protein